MRTCTSGQRTESWRAERTPTNSTNRLSSLVEALIGAPVKDVYTFQRYYDQRLGQFSCFVHIPSSYDPQFVVDRINSASKLRVTDNRNRVIRDDMTLHAEIARSKGHKSDHHEEPEPQDQWVTEIRGQKPIYYRCIHIFSSLTSRSN